MTIRIEDVRGMTAETAAALRAQGITNSEELLAACSTPEQRRQLAATIGIAPAQLLEYANRADLARIKGVGSVYGDILEDIGVDTVVELSRRNPENLQAAFAEAAAARGVRNIPSVQAVSEWIAQAKALERRLSY
jgi:predicted flap endonuclease-1-like 5' DNA nuclease